MHNLKVINKPKERTQVLVFGLLYMGLSAVLSEILPKIFFINILFNIIGYLILVEYFWNKHLGKELQYESKSINKALTISILLTVVFVFLIYSISTNGV
jgi:hypothetical protein